MNCFRSFNLAFAALIPAAAISLSIAGAPAQTPPAAAPPAGSTPATPAPTPPPVAAPAETADAFGEEMVLTPKTAVIVKGNANWDSAFATLIDSFKALSTLL